MLTASEVQQIIREGVPTAADMERLVERVGNREALARYPFHESMVRPGGTLSGPP